MSVFARMFFRLGPPCLPTHAADDIPYMMTCYDLVFPVHAQPESLLSIAQAHTALAALVLLPF